MLDALDGCADARVRRARPRERPAAARARRAQDRPLRLRRPRTRSAGADRPDARRLDRRRARLTAVQCVARARGRATPLSGTSVTLLRLSAPIGRQPPLLSDAAHSATRRRRTVSSARPSHDRSAASPPIAVLAARSPRSRPPRRRPRRRRGALYETGPDGRYLSAAVAVPPRHGRPAGCAQRFKRTDDDRGLDRRRPSPTRGTRPTSVDRVDGRHVGWYRKDFRLPSAAQRATAGSCASSRSTTARASGSTASRSARTRGAYLPFEIRLPAGAAQARRHEPARHPRRQPPLPDRLPALRPLDDGRADRRLVELRRDPARGLPAQGRPHRLQHRAGRCPTCRARRCDATVRFRVTVRNYGDRARQRVASPGASAAARVRPRQRRSSAPSASRRSRGSITRRATRGCGRPARPNLYNVALRSARRRARRSQRWHAARPASARSRSPSGACYLNGRPLNIRGVGLHEDDPTSGFAIDNARRAQSSPRSQGARRDDPALALPAASRTSTSWPTAQGILLWSEIPVYAVKTKYLKQRARPQARRQRAARRTSSPTATTRRSSSGRSATSCRRGPGPVQGDYIQRARRRRPRQLDPTRPVGLRRRRLPGRRLPARVRAARRHRHQRVLRLVPGPERPDRRPRRCCPTTSTRSAPATRTRRSWSPSSAPRPTATARSRRRARSSSSRTSSTTTSASTRRSRG